MYAKISANDTTAQAIGEGAYGTIPTVQNLGPNAAYVYGGEIDSELSDGARVAFVVSIGQKIPAPPEGGVTTWTAPFNPNGVDTSAMFVACATGETADCRIGA